MLAKRCANRRPTRRDASAFTLVELLVVVAILGALVGIALPAMRGVRQSAQKAECMSNLRSIGLATQTYMNTHDGLLPYALPLDDSGLPGGDGEPSPDSIMAAYSPLIESLEVFICPSDQEIPDSLLTSPTGPAGRYSSYEYWAGWLMLMREIQHQDDRPAFTVTRFYEEHSDFPVLADSEDRHPGGPNGAEKLAVYFGDWRAGWMRNDPAEEASL